MQRNQSKILAQTGTWEQCTCLRLKQLPPADITLSGSRERDRVTESSQSPGTFAEKKWHEYTTPSDVEYIVLDRCMVYYHTDDEWEQTMEVICPNCLLEGFSRYPFPRLPSTLASTRARYFPGTTSNCLLSKVYSIIYCSALQLQPPPFNSPMLPNTWTKPQKPPLFNIQSNSSICRTYN